MAQKSNFSTPLPCVACSKETENGSTFHHLYTQKTHPKLSRLEWNMIPLCQKCHNIVHTVGLNRFTFLFDHVALWLLHNDWKYDEFLNKWRHDAVP